MSNVAKLVIEPGFSGALETMEAVVKKSSAKDLLEVIPTLHCMEGEISFQMGGSLDRINEEDLWPGAQDKPKIPFDAWLEAQNIARSTGRRRIQIWRAVTACDLPSDIVERIEWTKLGMIASRLKPGKTQKIFKHNEKWISFAEKSTREDLIAEVRKAKGKSVKGSVAPAEHVLKLDVGQEKTFKAAIKLAKKETETKTEVKAVDVILSGYLADKTDTVTLETIMVNAGPVAVAKMFSKLWPDLDIKEIF